MLGLAGQAWGKHRRVFDQPQLIDGIRTARIGKIAHPLPNLLIRRAFEIKHLQMRGRDCDFG